MSIISWNCREIRGASTVRRLKTLCRKFSPDILFLKETKCKKEKMKYWNKAGYFEYSFIVDPEGSKGGIGLWCKANIQIDILSASKHWIHAHVTLSNQQQFLFTGVYGPSVLTDRNILWDFLNSIRPGNSPWIVLGDFNQIINSKEKLSKNKDIRGGSLLVDSINYLGLIDLPTFGNWFTWTNGRQGDDLVWERIDKTFSNVKWLHLFPETWVEVLPIAASDHSPLVIHVNRAQQKKPYSFKIEMMWLQHPQFQDIIRSNWSRTNSGSRALHVNSKLNVITKEIALWNKHEFGNISTQIQEIEASLQAIQAQIHLPQNQMMEVHYRKRLEFLLNCEEIMWAQRAQQMWLVKGDRNTRYFHTLVNHRRNKATIKIGFRTPFSLKKQLKRIPILNEDQIQHLTKPFTKFEIETALFQMKGSKAPGPDGMPPIFFQQFWDTVGDDITGMEVLTHMRFPVHWRKLIMECISTSTLRIRINGDYSGWFHPTAGLRQGDPLSPYLFVLCTNVLSSYLVQAEQLKHIQGPKLGRHVLPLNHLMYADDLLIFFKANQETCANVDLLLSIFGQASGLFMNKDKSEIKFSPNASANQKNHLLSIINCKGTDSLGKYLGAFIDGPKPDRQNAELIIDHLQQKLSGWKASLLSQAARLTLIQAILSAIPLYTLHFTSLTDKYAKKCNSLMKNFFWGNGDAGKKIPLIAWRKICRPKAEGGLGLRSIQGLNHAILGKQLYRIMTSKYGLMGTIMRAKYVDPYPNGNLTCRPYDSTLWKKLFKYKHLGTDHLKWRVGDGSSIHLYDRYWVPPDYHTHPFTHVSQLMSGGFWDSAKLRRVYNPRKIQLISQMNTSYTNQKDILVWGNSSSGKYELKDAYPISMTPQNDRPFRNCEWQAIWKLNLPYKIILFWWKTLHKGLPLRYNLKRRGFNIEDTCLFVCDESETESHVFKDWPFAKLVWFESKLMIRTENINQNSIIDWITHWVQNQDPLHFNIRNSLIPEAIVICWSIYTQRNQVLFQDGNRDHNEVLHRVSHIMNNTRHAFQLATMDPFFALDRSYHHLIPSPSGNKTHSSEVTIYCSWKKDVSRQTKSVILFTNHNSHIYPLVMLVVHLKNNILSSVAQCLQRWLLMPHDPQLKAAIRIPNRTLISQLQQRSLAPQTYSIVIDDIFLINSPHKNFTFTFIP
ncbi:putative ribonuclease H protein At1g65750 family [Senna tora]|uniref:Putative ribonuclease H protein At1g65750 family n=1 Tax=Senna tora TaxID=362788 RepID=A0A834W600_9FABA|nr:putative ribonuclease H protein At1g65750 family [Senna tora]